MLACRWILPIFLVLVGLSEGSVLNICSFFRVAGSRLFFVGCLRLFVRAYRTPDGATPATLLNLTSHTPVIVKEREIRT